MKLRTGSLSLLLLALAVGLAAALVAPGLPAQAQATGWTTPRLLFEAEGTTEWPTITADKYGQVHAFWSHTTPNADLHTIYYARLDHANETPVDIMIVDRQVRSLRSAETGAGVMVMWNSEGYAVSNGPAPRLTARDWLGPFTVGPAQARGGLASGPDGSAWMIYGGRSSPTINIEQYDPVVGSWSEPRQVASTVNANAAPDWARVTVGADGVLHAVWVEYRLPDGWPPLGVYYSQSGDNGLTWSLPRTLAPRDSNNPNVVTGPNDEVYVTWVGSADRGGKFYQQSKDGGLTWDNVVTLLAPDGGGGSQGSPYVVTDSAGRMHVMVAHNNCLYYFTKDAADNWSPGECITSGMVGAQFKEFPYLAVAQGNKLYVLFWTNYKQIWVTMLDLDTPVIEALVAPTQAPALPTTARPTARVAPTATYLPDLGEYPDPEATARSGSLAIWAGVAPVVLLFAATLMQRMRGRK